MSRGRRNDFSHFFKQNLRKSSPVSKVIGINLIIFLLWKVKGVPQTFLVKHFSFDQYNVNKGRYHTFFTYSFSHYLSILVSDMLLIGILGRLMILNFGNRAFLVSYFFAAFNGAIAMHLFMPKTQQTIVIPQVGSNSPIYSLATTHILFNIKKILSFSPIPLFIIFLLISISVYKDKTKQKSAGIITGLLMYQLLKIKF